MASRLQVFNGVLALVWAGLLALAAGHRHDLPPVADIHPALWQEPRQVPVTRPVQVIERQGITYRVQPLYDYILYGLVVSRHDAKSWLDSAHRFWHDHLNAVDVCVVWGRNLKAGVYDHPDIGYSSGQYTCYVSYAVRPGQEEARRVFQLNAISNNPLLAPSDALAKQLRKVRVGDQIMLQGSLANYTHQHGRQQFSRSTSTTRDDVGDGACETVLVDQVAVLRQGNPGWRFLFALSLLGLGVCAVLALGGVIGRERFERSD